MLEMLGGGAPTARGRQSRLQEGWQQPQLPSVDPCPPAAAGARPSASGRDAGPPRRQWASAPAASAGGGSAQAPQQRAQTEAPAQPQHPITLPQHRPPIALHIASCRAAPATHQFGACPAGLRPAPRREIAPRSAAGAVKVEAATTMEVRERGQQLCTG